MPKTLLTTAELPPNSHCPAFSHMSVTGIHSCTNHGGTTVGSLWNHHSLSFQQDLPKSQDRTLDKIGAVSIRRKKTGLL